MSWWLAAGRERGGGEKARRRHAKEQNGRLPLLGRPKRRHVRVLTRGDGIFLSHLLLSVFHFFHLFHLSSPHYGGPESVVSDRRRLQQEQGSPGLLTLAESALHLHLASTLLHVVDHPLLLSIVAAERCHWLHDGHPPAQPVSVQKTLHESTCTHTRKVMAPDARSALPFSCLLHSAFQPSSPSHWWPAPRSRCFSKSSSDCQYPGLIMTLAKLFQLTSTNNVHTHRVAGVCSISKPPGPLNSAGPER